MSVGLPYHFGQFIRLRVQRSPAFVHHDFHAPQTYAVVAAERRETSIDQLGQGVDTDHDSRPGHKEALCVEATEEGKVLQGVPGACIVKRTDTLAE